MARFRSIVLTLLFAATSAQAQKAPAASPPNAAEQAESDQLHAAFAKGKTEFDLGNYAEAVKYFEDAYRIRPVTGLLYNIAQCYRFVGNLDKAATTFRAFLRNAPPGDRNVPQGKALLAEVEKSIAQRDKLNATHPLGLAGGATPSNLNGATATVPPPAPSEAKPVPPPSAPAPAAKPLEPSTDAAATSSLSPPPAPTPAPPAPSPKIAVVQKQPPTSPAVIQAPPAATETTPPPAAESHSHIATYVVGGVGVVALGAGGFFGLQSKSLVSNLQSSTHSRSQIDSDTATAKSDASKATALMVGGAVALVAAGVLFLVGY